VIRKQDNTLAAALLHHGQVAYCSVSQLCFQNPLTPSLHQLVALIPKNENVTGSKTIKVQSNKPNADCVRTCNRYKLQVRI